MRGARGSVRLVGLVAALATAGCVARPTAERLTGFLIPSQCSPEEGVVPQPEGSVDAWPAPHTTACALRPACIESGYGLWAVDRFYRFDPAGHEKALRYFQTTPRTSYNKVVVAGVFADPDAVQVRSITPTD